MEIKPINIDNEITQCISFYINLPKKNKDVVDNRQALSDIHIVAGTDDWFFQIAGKWKKLRLSKKLQLESMKDFCLEVYGNNYENEIEDQILKRTINIENARLRCHAFLCNEGKLALSLRKLPDKPMLFNETGLPVKLKLVLEQQGLILVTGQTGSGKTTSIGAIVEYLNEQHHWHILTIEDPVEVLYTPKKSFFTQRDVGIDVSSFVQGIQEAMRMTPNVIVIGEIRDERSVEAALMAASTGHLVIASIHALSVPSVIIKMGQKMGKINDSLSSLESVLLAIVHQKLVPNIDNTGRVLATELLINDKGQYKNKFKSIDMIEKDRERFH